MSYRIVLQGNQRYTVSGKPSYWWWVLKSAGNGANLATSETYTTRRKALQAATKLALALDIKVEE